MKTIVIRPIVATVLALGVILAGGMLGAWAAGEGGEAAKPVKDLVPAFDKFQLVVERNIFSPTRHANAPREERKDEPPPYQAKTIRLMGTVLQGDQARALFEGDSDAPEGGVKPGDTVGGHTIEEIRTSGVVLAGNTGQVTLAVGAGLAEDQDGKWTVVDSVAVPQSAPAPPADTASASASGAAPADAGAASDDPAERLRARRRRELGQ